MGGEHSSVNGQLSTVVSAHKRPKIIAFYLPQFHSFPENDEWWGKGFTEWTNVRKSKPQFKGHIQPEIPMGNNYYNLLDSAVQERQAILAQRYHVDGFCYYHYWFSGKLLMERPMENMLRNSAVNQPFCICWANEHWSRNWDGQANKVIMPQNYSEKPEEWEEHFNYLLQFFRDERYICHDGKPIFIIYKPYLIENCHEMIEYWQQLAIKAGLPGLYFGYQYPESFAHNHDGFDFGIEFEPLYTSWRINSLSFKNNGEKYLYAATHWAWTARKMWNRLRRKVYGFPIISDYDRIWQFILSRESRPQVMPGAFPAWDNTPRRGKHASVYFGATPEKFKCYMEKALVKADKAGAEFFFINAWNEWGEGAHLEPDEYNGYGYLEAVGDAVEAIDKKG